MEIFWIPQTTTNFSATFFSFCRMNKLVLLLLGVSCALVAFTNARAIEDDVSIALHSRPCLIQICPYPTLSQYRNKREAFALKIELQGIRGTVGVVMQVNCPCRLEFVFMKLCG